MKSPSFAITCRLIDHDDVVFLIGADPKIALRVERNSIRSIDAVMKIEAVRRFPFELTGISMIDGMPVLATNKPCRRVERRIRPEAE